MSEFTKKKNMRRKFNISALNTAGGDQISGMNKSRNGGASVMESYKKDSMYVKSSE